MLDVVLDVFNVPSSQSKPRSLRELRGKPVFLAAEGPDHDQVNAPFLAHIAAFVEHNPQVVQKLGLVTVAMMFGAKLQQMGLPDGRVPSSARSEIRAMVATAMLAKGFALTDIWFDWDESLYKSLTAIGMNYQSVVNLPVYLLLDQNGNVAWGQCGKVEPKHFAQVESLVRSLAV